MEIACQKPYTIHMDADIFLSPQFAAFAGSSEVKLLVSDDKVGPIYKDKVLSQLQHANYLEIPSGEQYKTRAMKAQIEDYLLSHSYGRDLHILALGGGVILDMLGFVAATYCRGVQLSYLPTSLLAMVDVIVGGKTAVNTEYSKNSIGCFYTPDVVWADLNCLKTLDTAQFSSGMMELLKHALLFDQELLTALIAKHDVIQSIKISELKPLIERSNAIKAQIVCQDETEHGARALLNFGHTVGHALEQISQYQLLHGHAVAFGMVIEAQIANHDGILAQYIMNTIQKFGCPSFNDYQFHIHDIIKYMRQDKKNKQGHIKMVALNKIGKPEKEPINMTEHDLGLALQKLASCWY